MNMKKILVITILAIFVVGMIMGAADATHTFKKGKYKMKVTNNQYNKLKKSKPSQFFYIFKKVGTKTVKTVKSKTVKTETWRSCYDKNGRLTEYKIITHHKGYWGNANARWTGSKYKVVKYYNGDGSYYEDEMIYDTWRITQKSKKTIWMEAYKHPFYGDNKIHVSIFDFRPFPTKPGILHKGG